MKGSHSTTLGTNGIEGALKKSSNVYMFKTVIGMMGKEYQSGMSLPKKPEAVQEFRNVFSQFGLGVKTGIDLPNESNGLIGKEAYTKPGLFLDLSIGQYDNYTAMQLAQYISTIANGGYRLKPQLVRTIHTPSRSNEIGPVFQAFQPEVLNKITMEEKYLHQVQEGFRQVYQSLVELLINILEEILDTMNSKQQEKQGQHNPFIKTQTRKKHTQLTI